MLDSRVIHQHASFRAALMQWDYQRVLMVVPVQVLIISPTCRTQDMAGDPFGLLLRQRIIFLGGEASFVP